MPVDSMATWVTPHCWSQSLNAKSPTVMVEKVCTCVVAVPMASVSITHAVTDFLCTSIPQQRAWTTCMSSLPLSLARCGGHMDAIRTTTFLPVLYPEGLATLAQSWTHPRQLI